MKVNIKNLSQKKLVGKRLKMTMSANKTFELWRSFMPKRKEIINAVGTDLYSMQIYAPDTDFKNFDQNVEFEKWAATEVTDFNAIPEGMESYILEGGLYAVFEYKANSSTARQAFEYIFAIWLPNSDYILDNREHFELLGEKYKANDLLSEEQIWIPIRPKNN